MRQSLLTFPKSTKPVDPPNRPAPIERNNPQSDNTVQHKTQGQLSGSLGKTVQSKSSTMFTNKESDDVSFEWLFKVFQSEGSAKSIK